MSTHTNEHLEITYQLKNFSLQQIADSGQCFCIEPVAPSSYCLLSQGKYARIRQKDDTVILMCAPGDQGFWENYLDIATDYEAIINSVNPDDTYLCQAADYGRGIRILRQDPWEMIITFIISQQKTIPAIRQAVEQLSRQYGSPIQTVSSPSDTSGTNTIYAFPTPQQLSAAALEDLQNLKLGYRAKYIFKTTQDVCNRLLDLEYLKTLNYQDSMSYLKQFYGIGEKVANCICLFGLHHIDAFPVDTWIQKILMAEYYPKHPRRYKALPKSALMETIINDNFHFYKGFRGVMQQYIFYYERERLGRTEL